MVHPVGTMRVCFKGRPANGRDSMFFRRQVKLTSGVFRTASEATDGIGRNHNSIRDPWAMALPLHSLPITFCGRHLLQERYVSFH